MLAPVLQWRYAGAALEKRDEVIRIINADHRADFMYRNIGGKKKVFCVQDALFI